MKADLAKLRALGLRLNKVACDPSHYNEDAIADLLTDTDDAFAELLAIAEAVERAPVAVVVSAHYDYVKIDPPNGIPLEMIGQRVRLLAIGEDG